MGCKYLTSSQLFALELKDPSIRQQVCVQLLILIHHKLRVLASLPEALPPAPVLTSKKAPPPQATTNKQPTEKELIGIEKRIMALIESTPPSGEDLAMTLRMIFDGQREARWMQWKNDHCPAYEKAPLPVPTE
ncbi:THO1, partial [Symbiodinium microadriaticum]